MNNLLKEVRDFNYLASTISSNCTLGREQNTRISKAAAFGQLKDKVYLRGKMKLKAKPNRIRRSLSLSYRVGRKRGRYTANN